MELHIVLFMYGLCYSLGAITLNMPTAGNCGEDTVLTCQVTNTFEGWTWIADGVPLVSNGNIVDSNKVDKYTATKGSTSHTLTIHNTDIILDAKQYKCSAVFEQSASLPLTVECKASSSVPTVTSGKKLMITIDTLYPSTPQLSPSFSDGNSAVTIQGSSTCSRSTQYSNYYKCVWSSSNSVADGSYTYSVVVTTVTQADPLTGSFYAIATPHIPVIANIQTLDDNREVIYGTEGQSLIIQCTSSGGYPTQTVVLYKSRVSTSNTLVTKDTGTLQNNSTYTVILLHTLTPTSSDDRETYICRSYYPQADAANTGSKTKSVILYLSCQPDEPTHFTYLFKDNTHTFSWIGGFNGGYSQTFVIQTSIVGTEGWINRTTIAQILPGVTSYQASINALPPGTYVARIFAWTSKGTSEYVGLNDRLSGVKIETDPEIPTCPVLGVAGWILTVSLVLIIATGSIVFYKRRYDQKDRTPSRSANRKSHNTTVEETSYYNVANQGDTNAQQSVKSGSVQENDLQDVATYEALDANNEAVSTYSSLTPAVERHEDTMAYNNLQLHQLSN